MKKIKNILSAFYTGMVFMAIQLLVSPSVFATDVVTTTDPSTNVDVGGAFDVLTDLMQQLTVGITGVLSAVMTIVFIWKAFQFARTGDNPSERAKAINGMIFFFIGAACFGAASGITYIFQHTLQLS